MSEIRRGVRRLFRLATHGDSSAAADADEELRAFVDARVEHLVARGMSPADARREAESRLGTSMDDVREGLRRSARRRERRLDVRERVADGIADVRYAARSLGRDPLVTVFVVVLLALGIGANAAMFGIADRLLLRGPEHVRDADRVLRLYATAPNRRGELETYASFGYVTYALLARHAPTLAGVAAYQIGEAALGSGAQAENVSMGRATASFFPLLGVRPALGRFFTADEDATSGARHVAVIGHGLWQRLFAGQPTAIGATLLLGGESYEVVGVTPRGFTGVTLSPVDVWTPMSLIGRSMSPDWPTAWYWSSLRVVARLGPNVTPTQARENATTVLRGAYPGRDPMIREARWSFSPLSYDDAGKEPPELSIARWLVGVAVIVLLIACANVINLLLARSIGRQREIGVRLALGAGRARLVRLLLAEGMLLATMGGVASLLVAYVLGRLIRRVLLANVEWGSTALDPRVFLATVLIALAAGTLVGFVPALRASRPDLTAALKATARIGGGRRSRLRTALTLTQACLSVVLLIGAGLFVRSVGKVKALDLGVAADSVLAVRLSLTKAPSEETSAWQARRAAFYGRVLDRVRALPGVAHATLAVGVPFSSYYGVLLWIPGRDSLPALRGGSPRIQAVAGDYFSTVGTRILRGRAFTPADQGGAERVVIVSERLARAYWPGEDALGQCLVVMKKHDPCTRVVGISANTYTRDVSEEPGLQFYVPFDQVPFGGVAHLIVRPARDPAAMVAPLRRALLEVDSTLAYLDMKTLRQALDPQLRPWRLGTTLFGLFGILAMLVAAAGLYSLVASLVTTRVHEIGVRIALGATAGDVVRVVVRHSFGVAAAGTAIGMCAALAAGRFMEPLLFRTSARDPVVFAGVAALLLGVAIVAALVPARRATRISPVEALRYE